MRKLFVPCLLAMLTLNACIGNGKTDGSTETNDTTTDAGVTNPLPATKQTSKPEQAEASYCDLQLLDAKGNISSIKYDFTFRTPLYVGRTFQIDEKGMIVTIDGKKPKFTRDDQGRIIRYDFILTDDIEQERDCYTSMKYNEDGRLASWYTLTYCDEWITKIIYDKDGTEKEYRMESEGGITCQLKRTKTDSHGNWTTCLQNDGEILGCYTIERTITYRD